MPSTPERPISGPEIFFEGEKLFYTPDDRRHSPLEDNVKPIQTFKVEVDSNTYLVNRGFFKNLAVNARYNFPNVAQYLAISIEKHENGTHLPTTVTLLENSGQLEQNIWRDFFFNETSGEILSFSAIQQEMHPYTDDENPPPTLPIIHAVKVDIKNRVITLNDDEDSSARGEPPALEKELSHSVTTAELGNLEYRLELIRDDQIGIFDITRSGTLLSKTTFPFMLWKNLKNDLMNPNSFEWARNAKTMQQFSLELPQEAQSY